MITCTIVTLIKTAFKLGGMVLVSVIVSCIAAIVIAVVGTIGAFNSILSGLVIGDLVMAIGIAVMVKNTNNRIDK